jgi:hypothetical protein
MLFSGWVFLPDETLGDHGRSELDCPESMENTIVFPGFRTVYPELPEQIRRNICLKAYRMNKEELIPCQRERYFW